MSDEVVITAVVVVSPGGTDEQSVPVHGRLIVGRECAGVEDGHRLLILDRMISRTHLELRLDLERDEAWLIDHSTNGTRLNGRRIERFVPVRLRPGDRMTLGGTELEFRSPRFSGCPDSGGVAALDVDTTVRQGLVTQMVMVVGDVVSFSTIAENTDDRVLLANIEHLFAQLRLILEQHHGTLTNYAGDAFFATWEAGDTGEVAPVAAKAAVSFAIEAAAMVPRVAATLDLRDPAGGPIRMGWGVSSGQAAVSGLSGPLVAVLGDATNVAFRLSGVAGRDGRPVIMVTDAVHDAIETGFAFTALPAIQVKGRRKPVTVFGVAHAP
jgi:adenylate cyclase